VKNLVSRFAAKSRPAFRNLWRNPEERDFIAASAADQYVHGTASFSILLGSSGG
jgi:hypothetical protein